MKRMYAVAILSLLLFWVCLPCSPLLSSASAQTAPNVSSVGHGSPVSLDHLYGYFLEYQLYLDKKADTLPPAHPDVQMLRTPTRAAWVQRLAVLSGSPGCSNHVSAPETKDDQAKSIIDALHHDYPPGKVLTLPPPPELVQLQAEREAIISEAVVDLKTQLGTEASATMNDFLHKDFAPTVAFKPMHAPGPPQRPKASQGQVFTTVKP